jgi:hypothetical protein
MFPSGDSVDTIGIPSLVLYEEESAVLLRCTSKSTGDPQTLRDLYSLVSNQVLRIDEKNKSIEQAISLLKNL